MLLQIDKTFLAATPEFQLITIYLILEEIMEATNNSSIISIDELQNHGINAADILKLRGAGVCSIAVSKIKINQ